MKQDQRVALTQGGPLPDLLRPILRNSLVLPLLTSSCTKKFRILPA